MNKLIVQNKQCRLELEEGSPTDILTKVRKLLSFRQEGYEYTIAHRQSGWNGWTCLLTSKNAFPSGLQSKVEACLSENRIPYQIVDKREKKPFNKPMDISKNLKRMGFVPRDYQLETVEATVKHHKGICRLVTSAGKTATAALMTAHHNTNTIIYVIGLQLLTQFHDTLSEMLDCKIGYIGDGVCEIEKITVASIWSIGKAIGLKDKIFDDDMDDREKFKAEHKETIIEFLKKANLHIIDECHVASCATLKAIFKQIDGRIYGMSGTPFKNSEDGGGEDMIIEGILGPKIIDVSAAQLIDRGLIVQPTIKFVSIPAIPIYGRKYADVYTQGIVENDIRNALIVRETRNLVSKGLQTLVLFKQIKHGEILLSMFKKAKVNCVMLSGKNSLEERDEVKAKLLAKKIDVVIASQIFDIGIDINSLDALVLCGSGVSRIKSLQRIGRILRARPGKHKAYIVDFIDQVRYLDRHSKIRYKTYASEKGFIVWAAPEFIKKVGKL